MNQKNLLLNNVLIASGPVIIEKGKILLNKHGENKFWKFPGGDIYQKKGSLEYWCQKRVWEEMGVKIKIIKPLKPMIIWKENKIIILIHYLAKRINKTIKPAPFILDWGWFPVNKLPPHCAPNIKPVINKL